MPFDEIPKNKYRDTLKDVMDAFFDMSPLEYAESRGLQGMSDAEGVKILDRARKILAEEGDK